MNDQALLIRYTCEFGTKYICIEKSAIENSGPLLIQVLRRRIQVDRTLV